MLAQGQAGQLVALLTEMSSTAAGRATLLAAHQLVGLAIQLNGKDMTRQEFQVFSDLLKFLGQFAWGGR